MRRLRDARSFLPGQQNGGVGRALQGRICVSTQLLPDRYGGNFPRWPCGWRGLSGGGVMTDPIHLAALFVQGGGCYFGLSGVDAWDITRDARNYRGPYPVVAHPPCQLWGALAAVNYKRWGGEHNRPGNDGGCFAFALDAVNRFGGVLEHPAKTRAWAAHGLPAPSRIGWSEYNGGWVCEVWQSAYGHRANKATWLYYSGDAEPMPLRWDRPIGTHQVGQPDQRGKAANKPTLSKREANATPLEFRDELIRLAKGARVYA